jgi:hypothetical protein
MSDTSIGVEFSGPVFDLRANRWSDQATRNWEHVLAQTGVGYVQKELNQVLRKQTPYYRLQITTTEHPGVTVINDGGVVYGPWLEGTGSRNKTTRFKGYSTFRRMSYKLQMNAKWILEPYIDSFVMRVNDGA